MQIGAQVERQKQTARDHDKNAGKSEPAAAENIEMEEGEIKESNKGGRDEDDLSQLKPQKCENCSTSSMTCRTRMTRSPR